MMRSAKIAAAAFVLYMIGGTAVAQEAAPALKSNPFSRPAFVVDLPRAPAPLLVTQPAALELRTTLVGDGKALANINGEILAVGQSYENYRVLSIAEGRVVLSNDGERIALDLYEMQRGSVENDD